MYFHAGILIVLLRKTGGLGLSLSDQIIRGHGGKITVTSEEERGSCFVFSLPLFTETL